MTKLKNLALNAPKPQAGPLACVAVTRTAVTVGVTAEGEAIKRMVSRCRVKLGQRSVPLDGLLGFKTNVIVCAPENTEQVIAQLEDAILSGKLTDAIQLVEYAAHQHAIMRKMRLKLS